MIDIVSKKANLDPEKVRDTITKVKDRPGHNRRYAIDCSKIKRELNWKQNYIFEEGLKKTVEWYLEHNSWVDNIKNGGYKTWIEKNYNER